MSTITFDQIPVDMKTQLNNMLAIKRKNKEIVSYEIIYEHVEVSRNYPQSFRSICDIIINFDSKDPYKLRLSSEAFSRKADADRQSAFLCYSQINYDFKTQFGNEIILDEEEVYSSSDEIVAYQPVKESPYPSAESNSNGIYPLIPVVLPDSSFQFAVYVLIDIENKPNTSQIEKMTQKLENVITLKFVGVNHPNRKKGNIIVKSSYKDAADHAMSLYLGGIVQAISVRTDVIIYTGDRFASALQELCNFDMVHVYHMAHWEDVVQHLESYKQEGNILVDEE